MIEWRDWLEFFTQNHFLPGLKAIGILVVGWVIARATRYGFRRAMTTYLGETRAHVFAGFGYYFFMGLLWFLALNQVGFKFTFLIGAAGILTVTLGFAARGAVANLVAGLFLVAERPFNIGDTIQTDKVVGEVLAIDLVAVKLRTFDNLHVRIPNDVMLRTTVTTITRYEIRRYDLDLHLDFRTDMAKLKEVLLEVAEKQATSLEEPRPIFKFNGFSDIGIRVSLCTWTRRDKYLAYKYTFATAVKNALEKNGFRFASTVQELHLATPTALVAPASRASAAVEPNASGTPAAPEERATSRAIEGSSPKEALPDRPSATAAAGSPQDEKDSPV